MVKLVKAYVAGGGDFRPTFVVEIYCLPPSSILDKFDSPIFVNKSPSLLQVMLDELQGEVLTVEGQLHQLTEDQLEGQLGVIKVSRKKSLKSKADNGDTKY